MANVESLKPGTDEIPRGSNRRSGSGPDRSQNENRVQRILLASVWFWILTAGIVLRFWDLGAKPLWIDEIDDWYFCQYITNFLQFTGQISTLLYRLVERLALSLDPSNFGFRFPIALSSCLSLLATMELARRLIGNRGSVLAGLFMAFSVLNVYYAQEARPYAMASLFLVLQMIAADSLQRKPERRAWRILWFSAAVLASITIYHAWMLAFIQAIVMILSGTKHLRPDRLLLGTAHNIRRLNLVPYLIAFAVLSAYIFASLIYFKTAYMPLMAMPGYQFNLLRQSADIIRYLAGGQSLLPVVFVIGCLAGAWAILRDRNPERATARQVLYFTAAGSLVLFTAHLIVYKVAVRYFVPLLPFWVIVWSLGIDRLAATAIPRRRWIQNLAVGAVGIVVVGFSTPGLNAYYKSGFKWISSADFEAVHSHICRNWRPDDAVLSMDYLMHANMYYIGAPCTEGIMRQRRLRMVSLFTNQLFFRMYRDHLGFLRDYPSPENMFWFVQGENAGPLVRMPWEVRRFWISIPVVYDTERNDILAWWHDSVDNYYHSSEIQKPDGASLVWDGPMLVVAIPNREGDSRQVNAYAVFEELKMLMQEALSGEKSD